MGSFATSLELQPPLVTFVVTGTGVRHVLTLTLWVAEDLTAHACVSQLCGSFPAHLRKPSWLRGMNLLDNVVILRWVICSDFSMSLEKS